MNKEDLDNLRQMIEGAIDQLGNENFVEVLETLNDCLTLIDNKHE